MSRLYFERYSAGYGPLIYEPPPDDLALIITIPVHNEPDVSGVFHSLAACEEPSCPVEVIFGINAGEKAKDGVIRQNKISREVLQQLIKTYRGPLSFYQASFETPQKHAGVGMARKVIMDEALRRFTHAGKSGIIACLDADCVVDKHYLNALLQHFSQDTEGCSIRYEHQEQYHPAEIIRYEMHLRYYMHALRWTGFPLAYQTLGSCMAVRSDIYALTGGMNRRKAAEDFYFLQKVISRGKFSHCDTTSVFPSDRLSDRVPFGTGRAMQEMQSSDHGTYNPAVFEALRNFFSEIHRAYPEFPAFLKADDQVKEILCADDIIKHHQAALHNTKTFASFYRYFLRGVDGLRVLQLVHQLQKIHQNVTYLQAMEWLFRTHGQPTHSNEKAYLINIRKWKE